MRGGGGGGGIPGGMGLVTGVLSLNFLVFFPVFLPT